MIVTWFAIVFTGRYPKGIFDFVEGVFRWNNRVLAYAITLVTDRLPPSASPRQLSSLKYFSPGKPHAPEG